MTTYKEIFGKPIKTLTTDPSNAEAEGQIWYNSTSDTYKSVVVGAAWSAASPVLVATQQPAAGGNYTANAGLKFSGIPSGPTTNRAEEWNGSGWSIGGSMNDSARYGNAGTGTQTAAVSMGGFVPGPNVRVADVENYDGSAWTVGTDINTARHYLGATGPQTSIVAFGGNEPPYSAASEEWNGSAWTSGNSLNNARQGIDGVGTQTAAYAFSGNNPGIPAAINGTELYDGTSWTTGTSKNTPTAYYGCGGDGQSDAITFGGEGAPLRTATELWDGTAWTLSANMASAREARSGFGSTTNAIAGSGDLGPAGTLNTEEYNRSASVITAAAWASGGNVNTARRQGAGAGTQTATVIYGGFSTAFSGATEEYNGSAWTTSPASLSTARISLGGFGIQTAAVAAGGRTPPSTDVGNTEEYNGSAWTAGGTLLQARDGGTGAGILTAGLNISGESPTPNAYSNTEEYDGTSWTAGGALNTARYDAAAAGTQTATIYGSGVDGTAKSNTESYNGTAWTEESSPVITARYGVKGAGSQTSALAMLGRDGPGAYVALTENWDGSVWSTAPTAATARSNHCGAGTDSAAIAASGYTGTANTNATEEFTGETSANNFKTLTTS